MKSRYIMREIDGEKLKALLYEKGHSLEDVSAGIGRGRTYLSNCAYKGEINFAALKPLESLYQIKYDEIKPVKKPEPEEKPEAPHQSAAQTAPGPAGPFVGERMPQASSLNPSSPPQGEAKAADLSKIEIALKELVKQQTAMAEMLAMIRQGFRVQTKPMISSQDIAEGVLEGLKLYNRQAGTESKKELNRTIYAAVLSAMNKKDELMNEQLNRTDGIRTNKVIR